MQFRTILELYAYLFEIWTDFTANNAFKTRSRLRDGLIVEFAVSLMKLAINVIIAGNCYKSIIEEGAHKVNNYIDDH